MTEVLETIDLSKKYRRKYAANKINIHIDKGDIYGFIGNNGAGKTTLMKMICGLVIPDEGHIRLFDSADLNAGRKKTGSLIEAPSLFDKMSARDNLMYFSKMRGCAKKVDYDGLISLVGLGDTGKKKAGNFSLGMKQRLAIAIALIDEPEFIVLDEPINGLDPTGIREVRDLILKLNREKEITFLISSHILGELNKVATRYGIIRDGKLIEELSAKELEKRNAKYLRIDVSDAGKATEIIKEKFKVEEITCTGENTLCVYGSFMDDTDKIRKSSMASINRTLFEEGIEVSYLSVSGQDMESYFMERME